MSAALRYLAGEKEMTVQTDLRRKNRETVDVFFDLNQRDKYLSLWTEDGVKELPFAALMRGETRWQGIDQLRGNSEDNARRRAGGDPTRIDFRVYECADPNIFWASGRCSDRKLFDGVPYPQRYVFQLELRDGKIAVWREFFNSLVLERAVRHEPPPGQASTVTLAYDPPAEFSQDTSAAWDASADIVRSWLSADLADPKSRAELWADDAVFELPFAPPNQAKTSWRGRDELRARAEWLGENFAGCRHTDIEVFPTTDPGLVWARSRLPESATAFGRPYPQSYVFAFNLKDGKVQVAHAFYETLLAATVVPLVI